MWMAIDFLVNFLFKWSWRKRESSRLTFVPFFRFLLNLPIGVWVYNFIPSQIIIMETSETVPIKEAIVGALLVHSFEPNSKYELATWYRVADEKRKIVKMHSIKQQPNVSYRCTVFDLGAVIELRIESPKGEEAKRFGPVKFDPYLSKQLDNKNNVWFTVNLHLKINETLPARMRTAVSEEGELELCIETKHEKHAVFKVQKREDWRTYEQIFDIQDTKLTDVCVRGIENQATFKQKLESLSIVSQNRNYLQITFANVVQRNLFLAQIIARADNQNQKPRNSELKSVVGSQCKSHTMENEFDELFKSNLMVEKTARLSQKTYNDLQAVVFTPIMDLEEEEKGFATSNFGQFLNPEDNKELLEKLSDIAQEESSIRQRSTRNIHKNSETEPKTKVHFIQKIKKRKKSAQKEEKWERIVEENSKLKEQNIRLKKENEMLRKRLTRTNTHAEIRYQIPEYIRNELKVKSKLPNGSRSYRSRQNQPSNRERTCQFTNSQASNKANKKEKDFAERIRGSSASDRQAREYLRKRLAKAVSQSVKEVKRFLHSGNSTSHE